MKKLNYGLIKLEDSSLRNWKKSLHWIKDERFLGRPLHGLVVVAEYEESKGRAEKGKEGDEAHLPICVCVCIDR